MKSYSAERGGFEPPMGLPPYILSKDARSTTRPSLQIYILLERLDFTMRSNAFPPLVCSFHSQRPICCSGETTDQRENKEVYFLSTLPSLQIYILLERLDFTMRSNAFPLQALYPRVPSLLRIHLVNIGLSAK